MLQLGLVALLAIQGPQVVLSPAAAKVAVLPNCIVKAERVGNGPPLLLSFSADTEEVLTVTLEGQVTLLAVGVPSNGLLQGQPWFLLQGSEVKLDAPQGSGIGFVRRAGNRLILRVPTRLLSPGLSVAVQGAVWNGGWTSTQAWILTTM